MVKTLSKRGRPTAIHRTSWGEYIEGLLRRADGRWKISATGKTFVEPDERLAVARFRQFEQQQSGSAVGTIEVLADPHAAAKAMGKRLKQTRDASITVSKSGRAYAIHDASLSPEQWAWLRKQIIEQPKWVAAQCGIEQIGWLTDVKRPTESLRLAELIEIYAAKPGIQSEQVARYRRFWKEFAKIVGIETIRELSHEHVEKYEAKINDGDLAPKSIKHRYSGIRTVIAYALKRGKGIEDCRKALDVLAMLEAGNTVSLDPNPISPADFWAIHGAAEKAGDKVFAALMLFALNAAMYSSEVGAVRWDEIKLGPAEFATRRNKSKVPRVACLWPETVKAVKALPRDRETIFNTRIQAYNRFSVHRMWEKYRDDAKLPNVTFAMIRDAAFTIGCRISSDAARVLSGHRFSGAVDSYVLRQPQFVRDVCDAIRKEFFAGRPK